MNPTTRPLKCAALALVLTLMLARVPGAFSDTPLVPTPVPTTGCAGETWTVSTQMNHHEKDREYGPGNLDPNGFPRNDNGELGINARFTSGLRNGKMHWISRDIDWYGSSSSETACFKASCVTSGAIELGPADIMTREQQRDWVEQSTPRCQVEKNPERICAPGYFPYALPRVSFPTLPSRNDPHWSYGPSYNVYVNEYGETRTIVILEERGTEKVTIEAEHSTILPNQTVGKNDEATSQLSVKLTCDGVPVAKHWLDLRIDVVPRSGGHNHLGTKETPRPRGKLLVLDPNEKWVWVDCGGDTGKPEDIPCTRIKTDDEGKAKFKFQVPLTAYDKASYGPYWGGVAGTYTITARSTELATYGKVVTVAKASTDVRAQIDSNSQPIADKVPIQIQQNTVLKVDRGGKAAHPAGDWGTPGTLQKFEALAEDFHQQLVLHYESLRKCGQQAKWDKPETFPLTVNDIALEAGGTFDARSTWSPPVHQTHNKGEGGDFNRFGAGAEMNFERVPNDCKGGTAIKQFWYAHLLLDLGTKYGYWDCSDLSGRAPSFEEAMWNPFLPTHAINRSACQAGEVQDQVGGYSDQNKVWSDPTYFPPNLHLHVED